MVACVIGLAAALIHHNALGPAIAARHKGMDIVLPVSSRGETSLTVHKRPAPHIAGRRLAPVPLNRRQHLVGGGRHPHELSIASWIGRMIGGKFGTGSTIDTISLIREIRTDGPIRRQRRGRIRSSQFRKHRCRSGRSKAPTGDEPGDQDDCRQNCSHRHDRSHGEPAVHHRTHPENYRSTSPRSVTMNDTRIPSPPGPLRRPGF